VEEVEIDLQTTTAVSGFKLRLLGAPLYGATLRRYRFDEGFGWRSRAYDLSGEKGHGTVVGGTWIDGKHGGALSFDGVDDRLETELLTQIEADGPGFSIALWMKAPPGATGVIAGFGETPAGNWNRVQLNFSSDKVRLYARDDSGNVLQYTTSAALADDTWHHLVGVVSPAEDAVRVYVDGELDGGASGALGVIALDVYDLTFGCLHTQAGYTDYAEVAVDEAHVFSRALGAAEVYRLFVEEPRSGAVRAGVGDIVMVYLASAAEGEEPKEKLIRGRIVDRVVGGEPDSPTVELVGEDLGELMLGRTYTGEFASPTQISAVVEAVADAELPEFTHASVETTNRTMENAFEDEPVFSLLQKLAKTASFPSGGSAPTSGWTPAATSTSRGLAPHGAAPERWLRRKRRQHPPHPGQGDDEGGAPPRQRREAHHLRGGALAPG